MAGDKHISKTNRDLEREGILPGAEQDIQYSQPVNTDPRVPQASLRKPNPRTKSHQNSLRQSTQGGVSAKEKSLSPKGRVKKKISLSQLQTNAQRMLRKMKYPEQVYKSDRPNDIFSVATLDALVKNAISYQK